MLTTRRREPRASNLPTKSMNISAVAEIFIDASLGFEPRFCGSEPHVLPLDDKANFKQLYCSKLLPDIKHQYPINMLRYQ